MISPGIGPDTATQRYRNALALFDEFVRATVSDPDAATLRGLERRFAERIEIQPSYWSQIKSRSRQIGERLARQFEQRCGKPAGWMDQPHVAAAAPGPFAALSAAAASRTVAGGPAPAPAPTAPGPSRDDTPRNDDERFIVGLVLSYYRSHPQRARQRLLDLLGEVLMAPPAPPPSPPKAVADPRSDADLWARTRQGIAPLKKKKG